MDTCNQCDAKDQITIAGKSFCANCGTVAPSPQTVQASTAPAVSSAQPMATSATQAAMPAAQPFVPQTAPNEQATVATPAQIVPAQNSSSPSAIETSTTASSNTGSSLQHFAAMSAAAASSAQPIAMQPTASISSPGQVIPAQSQRPSGAAATPVAIQTAGSASSVPAMAPTQTINTAPTAFTPSEPGTNVGSEISSLDTKDEAVFSDDQLSALASTSNQTTRPAYSTGKAAATVPNLRSVAMNDIKPSSNVMPQTAPATLAASAVPASPTAISTQPSPSTVQPAAQSPQAKPAKKKSTTVASLAMSVVGLALVGAYIWQVNYPNLALKVANSKAGVNASMPSYLPSGWKVSGGINAAPGVISYSLASSDNKKNVVVSQSRTDWDSQALAENYVSTKANNYLSLQAQGLTVYLYGNSQASWVNHGTWYKIDAGNSSLSQEQIIKMATSL